jgi:hypothetical protein
MNRQNRILLALLAAQLVALAVVFWPKGATAQGQPLFGELLADEIVRLTIHDAAGQQVQLARGSQGWELPDAGDYPVQAEKVATLLDSIVQLRADRLVTRTNASHKQLQVAEGDFVRLVEFELLDGARHKLYLGTSPSFEVLHVRVDDDDAVYLALGLSASDVGATPAAWIDTAYLVLPRDQIVAVTLSNVNGRFAFTKDDAGNWAMEGLAPGEVLNQNNVGSLAMRASSLRMLRPLGREAKAEYGLESPNATLEVQTRDAEGNESVYIVHVGSLFGDGEGYVAKSATSPYFVLLADYTVDDLMNKTRQDFLEAPPTPEPELEPTGPPTPTPTP